MKICDSADGLTQTYFFFTFCIFYLNSLNYFIYRRYPGGSLFVNGRRQTLSRRWQVYNIDGSLQGPLNTNIRFYSNHESGLCTSISVKYTGNYNPLPRICTEKAYFVCEHFQRTQNPPVLNTTPCRYKRDLYSNNIYLKSVCTVFESLNYDEGRRRCAGLGMNLFMFDTAEVDEAFFENTEDIMRTYGGFWWINGLRNPKTNDWSLYHANRVLKGPLYSGFEFVQLNGVNGVSSGDCLRLSSHYGPHQGLGISCDAKSAVLCEFNKNY